MQEAKTDKVVKFYWINEDIYKNKPNTFSPLQVPQLQNPVAQELLTRTAAWSAHLIQFETLMLLTPLYGCRMS